jgi:quercetin dioxygenase-like cupin family protein
MNPLLNTLDPVSTPVRAKTILSKDGFTCALIALAPGDETQRHDDRAVEEHLLFVVEGTATVRFDDVNTILNQGEALHIPKGRAHAIAAGPSGGAKLLRVDVPPRQVIVPPLVSMSR